MKRITTLNKLKINQKATVIKIDEKSNLKRRLEDLGIIKGTIITPEFKAPFNDPTAYLIKGCTIAIRDEDANDIKVIINDK